MQLDIHGEVQALRKAIVRCRQAHALQLARLKEFYTAKIVELSQALREATLALEHERARRPESPLRLGTKANTLLPQPQAEPPL
jgi:hypothetical protein